MKIHPTAEEIRVALKKKQMKITFFEVEELRNSKSRTYRIGSYRLGGKGLTTDEVLTIVNEHIDLIKVEPKNIDGAELVDFVVKDFDGRRSDQEFFDFFASGDFSDEETVDIHIGAFMQQMFLDFGRDVIDRDVDTREKLNELVTAYSKKYKCIYSMIWSDETKLPDTMTSTPDRIRRAICNIMDDNMFDRYYATVILPQIKEAYPHWNL